MKRLPFYLFLSLLTFVVGIAGIEFWLLKTELPDVPVPKSQKVYDSSFSAALQFSKEQKKFWEKELLPRFKELPLESFSDSADETYRMVLLPTFDAPITVRIWRSGSGYFLITKKTNGSGGYGMGQFGKLSYEKTRSLTEDEWNSFIRMLEHSSFWDMPSLVSEEPVSDGASWIMEGLQNKKFHEVLRITPSKEFEETCVYFLKSAGFEKEYQGYLLFSEAIQ